MSETSGEFGLKEDWDSIVNTLEAIIPVYDKTNRYISLGTDLKIRKRGLSDLRDSIGKNSFSVIDLGCGTGKMSQLLLESGAEAKIVLADRLRGMLRVARNKFESESVICVYENLPIRPDWFDAAMSGFSLRDAKDLAKALGEVRGLLKEDGKFLIVDLSRPDSKLKGMLIATYWRVLSPLIAFIAAGRLGLRFGELYTTYKRLPKNSEMLRIMKENGFEVSKARFSMLGGVCVILLRKLAQP